MNLDGFLKKVTSQLIREGKDEVRQIKRRARVEKWSRQKVLLI